MKCADMSAVASKTDILIVGHGLVFQHISTLSDDQRKALVDNAVNLEEKTVSSRAEDGWLCQGGMGEIAAALNKAGETAGKTPPRSLFLPRDHWESKWQQMRSEERERVTQFVAMFKDIKPRGAKP